MKARTPDVSEPPVHVVLIDGRGIVTDVNVQGGRSAQDCAAIKLCAIGDSYFDHCQDDSQKAEVQSLLKRKRTLVSFVYQLSTPKNKRWFAGVGVPISSEVGSGAVLMHIDITQWVPSDTKGAENPRGLEPPVTLNPALIQDTITKALVRPLSQAAVQPVPEPRAQAGIDSLSPRQREVLLLVADGKSNLEIAAELSCSLNTVKRHVTAVLQKLHLPNRTRAAMLANQLNLNSSGGRPS